MTQLEYKRNLFTLKAYLGLSGNWRTVYLRDGTEVKASWSGHLEFPVVVQRLAGPVSIRTAQGCVSSTGLVSDTDIISKHPPGKTSTEKRYLVQRATSGDDTVMPDLHPTKESAERERSRLLIPENWRILEVTTEVEETQRIFADTVMDY